MFSASSTMLRTSVLRQPRALPLLARGLCATQPPAAARAPLYQLPPLSNRKERMQKHGLVSLGAEFVRLEQQGSKAQRDKSFRVQSYNVPLQKPAEFALTAVYGFGRNRGKVLAAKSGIFGHFRLSCMRESQREYIRRELNAACIAYDAPEPGLNAGAALQKEVLLNIQQRRIVTRGHRHAWEPAAQAISLTPTCAPLATRRRLKDIRSYRGSRHERRLPSRGKPPRRPLCPPMPVPGRPTEGPRTALRRRATHQGQRQDAPTHGQVQLRMKPLGLAFASESRLWMKARGRRAGLGTVVAFAAEIFREVN